MPELPLCAGLAGLANSAQRFEQRPGGATLHARSDMVNAESRRPIRQGKTPAPAAACHRLRVLARTLNLPYPKTLDSRQVDDQTRSRAWLTC